MENFKEKLKIQNILMGICSAILLLFSLLAIGSELGWFTILQPKTGDSHWHSTWYGFCTGASCGLGAMMLTFLIRNLRAMKDEKKLKKLYIKENDERTAKIVIYARSSAMQAFLFLGMAATVIAGYFSPTVSITILACVFFCSLTSLFFNAYYNKKF